MLYLQSTTTTTINRQPLYSRGEVDTGTILFSIAATTTHYYSFGIAAVVAMRM